jgi:hypothetical protein
MSLRLRWGRWGMTVVSQDGSEMILRFLYFPAALSSSPAQNGETGGWHRHPNTRAAEGAMPAV